MILLSQRGFFLKAAVAGDAALLQVAAGSAASCTVDAPDAAAFSIPALATADATTAITVVQVMKEVRSRGDHEMPPSLMSARVLKVVMSGAGIGDSPAAVALAVA